MNILSECLRMYMLLTLVEVSRVRWSAPEVACGPVWIPASLSRLGWSFCGHFSCFPVTTVQSGWIFLMWGFSCALVLHWAQADHVSISQHPCFGLGALLKWIQMHNIVKDCASISVEHRGVTGVVPVTYAACSIIHETIVSALECLHTQVKS